MAGGRRIARGGKNNHVSTPPPQPVEEKPSAVKANGSVFMKHIRLPPLPRESDLIFEFIILFHIATFCCLQFLHLYKTVWWLPQSFNSTGLNFYLIDENLIIFIGTLLGRRLPYLLLRSVFRLQSERSLSTLRFVLIGPTMAFLKYSSYSLLLGKNEETGNRSHFTTILNATYLFAPWVVYLYVYGFSITSFFEPQELQTNDAYANHVCSGVSSQIREEAEVLRKIFNVRMRRLILQSTFMAYYSSFLPWAFVQQHVFYDIWFVIQHIILTWMLSFSLLVSRAFPPDISDFFHKVACHLGKWTPMRPHHGQSQQWHSDHPPFLPGSVVKHHRELYKAVGYVPITSEPGNTTHLRFQYVFSGSSFARTLLCYHISIIIVGLMVLMKVTEWYQILSIGSLLVMSLFTFVRLARDFLVVWKMYQAEELITLRGSSLSDSSFVSPGNGS